MEKTLTPEESLQIIQKSISNSRRNMREGSFYYLLWGWALILAGLANYFLIRYLIGQERYDDIMLMSLLAWGVFLVAAGLLMGLMTFLSLKVDAYPTPFILGVPAMATAVSGLMVRFRPLVIGALVFMAAAVISSYLRGTDQLLVFAVAMVLGYLIPGYIIRSLKNGDNV